MSPAGQHRHESCRDRDCDRPYCRIWREARAEGYEEGHADGYAEGFAAGAASGGE
jgi:hypothetical protein